MIIKKDQSIVDLISRLRIDEHGWCVLDHWEADQCAIGISNSLSGDRLVYVSTYNLTKGRYNCECEKRNPQSSLGYDVVYEAEDIDFDELHGVLDQHLRQIS